MLRFYAAWESGREVIFRSLTLAEYRRFESRLRREPPAGVYLDIYQTVVEQGPSALDLTAGIVDFVGRVLTETNPFSGRYEDLARAIHTKRAEVHGDFILAAKGIMASIFHVPFSEIDMWDPEEFFEHLAQAEIVTGQ